MLQVIHMMESSCITWGGYCICFMKYHMNSHTGLSGFDLPLVYIFKDVLNQPIFGSNNLKGGWW